MSRDTDPRAARTYRRLLDRATPGERLAQAVRLSASARSLAEAGLRRRHPEAGDDELRWRLASLCYGRTFADRVFGSRGGAPD